MTGEKHPPEIPGVSNTYPATAVAQLSLRANSPASPGMASLEDQTYAQAIRACLLYIHIASNLVATACTETCRVKRDKSPEQIGTRTCIQTSATRGRNHLNRQAMSGEVYDVFTSDWESIKRFWVVGRTAEKILQSLERPLPDEQLISLPIEHPQPQGTML
ncbi:hypothetical protein [Agrobacterium tumefaciens]|uniref:hypothetical protein n=1 Tax=Agrobacterium tumefaciens TaxID=358 RepID=UPI00287DC970|nr:hypothetical protein [Agrobacterium tumefaciens]MDS7594149.1 hypothetical protein [Agrobacterium tumefaciens]